MNLQNRNRLISLENEFRVAGGKDGGKEELGTTERLHLHFSLSCIGEGHGNPLQCSSLENPRDRGAWGAAVCGVTQIQTQLM